MPRLPPDQNGYTCVKCFQKWHPRSVLFYPCQQKRYAYCQATRQRHRHNRHDHDRSGHCFLLLPPILAPSYPGLMKQCVCWKATTKELKAHWNGRYRWKYGFHYQDSTHALNHSFHLKQCKLHRATTPLHSHNKNGRYKCREGCQYWQTRLSRYCLRCLKRWNFHQATTPLHLLAWSGLS